MSVSLTDLRGTSPGISVRVHSGTDAPFQARRSVLSELGGQLAESGVADLALIISELVTSSVLHANVGSQQTLTVECATLPDRLRITVTDPGSGLKPHVRSVDGLGGRRPGASGRRVALLGLGCHVRPRRNHQRLVRASA
jgi:hypothetical protein